MKSTVCNSCLLAPHHATAISLFPAAMPTPRPPGPSPRLPAPLTTRKLHISAEAADWVVLLHGLMRTLRSMETLARAFQDDGYNTCLISYPSTRMPIERLARDEVSPILASLPTTKPLNFVTHSMGGIIVRQLAANGMVVARVVMLAPPNCGSEVVDSLSWLPPFHWLNGPAGAQLGTGVGCLTRKLGKVNFETGVVAGRCSFNLLLSMLIPGENDGKVSVASTKVEGMKDFRVIDATHTFIMSNKDAIEMALRFIGTGGFD